MLRIKAWDKPGPPTDSNTLPSNLESSPFLLMRNLFLKHCEDIYKPMPNLANRDWLSNWQYPNRHRRRNDSQTDLSHNSTSSPDRPHQTHESSAFPSSMHTKSHPPHRKSSPRKTSNRRWSTNPSKTYPNESRLGFRANETLSRPRNHSAKQPW